MLCFVGNLAVNYLRLGHLIFQHGTPFFRLLFEAHPSGYVLFAGCFPVKSTHKKNEKAEQQENKRQHNNKTQAMENQPTNNKATRCLFSHGGTLGHVTRPSIISFGAATSVCEKASQWRHALGLWKQTARQSLRRAQVTPVDGQNPEIAPPKKSGNDVITCKHQQTMVYHDSWVV